MKYKKRVSEVDAWQFTVNEFSDLKAFQDLTGLACYELISWDDGAVIIGFIDIHGLVQNIRNGDYLLKLTNVDGETGYAARTEESFLREYEPVDDK